MKLSASPHEASLFLVSRIAQKIHNLNRRFEKTHGMSIVQWSVLKHLVDLPGTSAHQLAEAVGVHPSTLTQTLKRLLKKRYLVVSDHPGDSRRKHIFVTREGNQAVESMRTTNQEILAKIAQVELELTRVEAVFQ